MGTLIQDVTPPASQDFDTVQSVTESATAEELSNEALIAELWERGVTITQVFGQFYALDEMATSRGEDGHMKLTLEDAELAGVTELPPLLVKRQPF